MKYINKNQIISASLACHKRAKSWEDLVSQDVVSLDYFNSDDDESNEIVKEWELCLTMNSILTRQKTLKNVTDYIPYEYRIFKETKEDCMALAEKLGLTLID